MTHKEQMLDELGRRITDLVGMTEIAQKLHIKIRLDTLENKLLECKNLVNKLKGMEEDGQSLFESLRRRNKDLDTLSQGSDKYLKGGEAE
jgi:hypothetical protein